MEPCGSFRVSSPLAESSGVFRAHERQHPLRGAQADAKPSAMSHLFVSHNRSGRSHCLTDNLGCASHGRAKFGSRNRDLRQRRCRSSPRGSRIRRPRTCRQNVRLLRRVHSTRREEARLRQRAGQRTGRRLDDQLRLRSERQHSTCARTPRCSGMTSGRGSSQATRYECSGVHQLVALSAGPVESTVNFTQSNVSQTNTAITSA